MFEMLKGNKNILNATQKKIAEEEVQLYKNYKHENT